MSNKNVDAVPNPDTLPNKASDQGNQSPTLNEIEQLAAERQRQYQTGPKTERGKSHSRWNALSHGRYAKSAVLPFEDESLYKKHIRETRIALEPQNHVEEQIVDAYANALWRIQRQENYTAYQRDQILEQLTPAMMANMLGLSAEYCAQAPKYLVNLKYKIPKQQELLANMALEQYDRLMENAAGIANFNLVWRQFPDLFNALSAYIDREDTTTPLFTSSGKDLTLAWQQHPKEIVVRLEKLVIELFYMANHTQFKPQIRLLMEAWYFAQKSELQRIERDDAALVKERKHASNLLDKLIQLRKAQYALWALAPKEKLIQGFIAPKEINFRK